MHDPDRRKARGERGAGFFESFGAMQNHAHNACMMHEWLTHMAVLDRYHLYQLRLDLT